MILERTLPRGDSHCELVTLDGEAHGDEGPLVIDKSQAPSYGTSSFRFGFWTGTVVEKNGSIEGFIDDGSE